MNNETVQCPDCKKQFTLHPTYLIIDPVHKCRDGYGNEFTARLEWDARTQQPLNLHLSPSRG